MAKRHISLIVKGPVKSAKRAAARHGVTVSSCRATSGRFADVQCYAPCKPSTNRNVVGWYTERGRSKAGRGFPPGTLLYHGEMCAPGRERGASMLRGDEQHPSVRGRSNAVAMEDRYGCKGALEWLKKRQADPSKPLDPRYIRAYRDTLSQLCRTELGAYPDPPTPYGPRKGPPPGVPLLGRARGKRRRRKR